MNPSETTVRVKSIGIAMGLTFPLSVKYMLKHRDMKKVIRYGICICTYTGQARATTLDTSWLDRAFSDVIGVAKYFRKMSCGRQFVEWVVFPYTQDIMTIDEKRALEKIVAKTTHPWDEIEPTWRAALAKGIPVNTVDRVIFVIDEPSSRAGTTHAGTKTDSHTFLAANDIRPNVICHEMGHAFGLPHADQAQNDDYGDSYCVMGGRGPNPGLEFKNPRLTVKTGLDSHDGTGPGICTPYLSKLGWIDSSVNANHIYVNETTPDLVTGDLTGTIYANQGGLPVGSTKRIALIVEPLPIPMSTIIHDSQYWIEYRIPQGFDQKIFDPPDKKDYAQGALLLREVVSPHSYDVMSPHTYDPYHSYYFYWTPIKKDQILRLPKLNYVIKITDFDSAAQGVSYSFEKPPK